MLNASSSKDRAESYAALGVEPCRVHPKGSGVLKGATGVCRGVSAGEADRIRAWSADARRGPDRNGVVAGRVGNHVDLFLTDVPNFVLELGDRGVVRAAYERDDVDAVLFDDQARVLACAQRERIAMHFPAIQTALDRAIRLEGDGILDLAADLQHRGHDTGKSNDCERGTATIESRHH